MTNNNSWEKIYNDTPVDKIPWRSAPATWFYQLVDNGDIKASKVLELGCGTGEKAIYLTKKGFNVDAIDISETAIAYARSLADKEEIKINLHAKDATDLSFLKDCKFDFVLDFANLHGIVREKQKAYAQEIIKHTKTGGLFYLRCFSKRTPDRNDDFFNDRLLGGFKVWYFSEEDISTLFSSAFKILKRNKEDYKTPVMDIYFDEYLMERL